jgi:hypothetical protein
MTWQVIAIGALCGFFLLRNYMSIVIQASCIVVMIAAYAYGGMVLYIGVGALLALIFYKLRD